MDMWSKWGYYEQMMVQYRFGKFGVDEGAFLPHKPIILGKRRINSF